MATNLNIILKENKKFFIISGTIVGTVLLFIAYTSMLANPEKIKTEINNFFTKEIDKYLDNYNINKNTPNWAITGNVSFKFFPKVLLNINDVKLENIYYKNSMVNSSIKNISLRLKTIPFFLGRMEIKDISINSAKYNVNLIKYINEYKITVKEDKIVDAEDNEIDGIGAKLKDLLGNDDSKKIGENKKIIQVDVEKTITVDNTKLKTMIVDIFNNFSKNFFGEKGFKDSHFILNNNEFSLYKDNNRILLKSIKDIYGNVDFNIKKGLEASLSYNIDQERIQNKISYKIHKDKNNLDLDFNSNNIIKSIIIKFSGKIDNFFNIDTWNGIIKLKGNISGIHDFANIISTKYQSENSNFMLNKNNKDVFDISGSFKLDNGLVQSDDIKIDSNGIKLNANFNRKKDAIIINANATFFDFGRIFLRSEVQSKINKKNINKDIIIFNSNKNLTSIAKKMNKNIIGGSFKYNIHLIMNIDEFLFNNITFKENKVDIDINRGNVRFNNFELNHKDYSLKIDNSVAILNTYFNNIHIHGINSKDIFKKFKWIKDIDSSKEFDINGKFIINKDLLIFKDSILKSGDNRIKFDLEYGLNENNKYFALNTKINEGVFKTNGENFISMKQWLLFVNDLNNNTYIKLNANKVYFNDYVLTNFSTASISHSGYLLLKNLSFDMVGLQRFKGNVEFNILTNKPKINIDFVVNDYIKNKSIVPYLLNLEKYRKILSNDSSNNGDDKKYWVKRLFAIPSFEGINGNIKFTVNSSNFNNVNVRDLNLDMNFEDGKFDLSTLNCEFQNGNLNINGDFIIKDNERAISLKIDKNIYSLIDLGRLITNSSDSFISGVFGIGGYFNASGNNISTFISSISSYFEFVGNNIFLKNFGLSTLRENLTNIHMKKDLLFNIDPKDVLLKNNNGTLFKKVNGKIYSQLNVYRVEIEGTGDGITNKFDLTISNTKDQTHIDLLNTSAMVVLINKAKIPLYAYISFKENIKDKAKLDFNLSNIEEYLSKVRKQVEVSNTRNTSNINNINTEKNTKKNVENISFEKKVIY